jgi:hypothetical protein
VSIADLDVAAAAQAAAALLGRPEFQVASPIDRPAQMIVANDLAGCLALGRLGPVLRCPGRGVAAFALRNRRFGRLAAALDAFVVVIENRAFGADDLAALVAVSLEAVLADQRADPRRL